MPPETQIFGLENFGNTCYCNSVIQALYHTYPFREYILGLAPPGRATRRTIPGEKTHPVVLEAQLQAQLAAHAGNTGSRGADSTSSPVARSGGFSSFRSRFSKSGGAPSAGHPDSGACSILITASGTDSITSFASSSQESSSGGAQGGTGAGFIDMSPTSSIFLDVSLGSAPLVGIFDADHTPLTLSLPQSIVGAYSGSGSGTNGGCSLNGQTELESLIEMRKKNALLRGPIANVDRSFSDEYNLKESVVTSFIDLFESISQHESVTGVASPSRLVEVIKSENELFRSSMHQDAQEFFNFVLNCVIEEDKKRESASRVSARSIFAGELTNEMRCLFCETVTRRFEPFYDFSLETLPNTSVYHCLQRFCGPEVLGGNNKFYCDVCGGHQEALKRMKVRKAPPVLVLHLKRFKFSEDEQRNTKLLHRVLYSKYLRLPLTTDDCTTPEKLYELTSVIVHLGGGPYQGHYVVVSKTARGWLLYDDEIVDHVDEFFVYRFFGDRASLSTAYLLIYQEVSEMDHEKINVDVTPEQGDTETQLSTKPSVS